MSVLSTLSEEAEKPTTQRKRVTPIGKILLAGFGASVIGVFAVSTPFLLPALRRVCLPFVPATTTQVQHVLTLMRGQSGTVVDLGSGDGRIVLELARQGFKSTGYELNPWLVAYSKIQARRCGLHTSASFYARDLWKVNLSSFDHTVIFGVEQMMAPLETKLSQELKPGSRIIACRFPFPNWQPAETVGHGIDTVWLYELSNSHSHKSASR